MERGIVKSIKRLENKPEFVYNLEIEDNHNYFIEGVLLHNSPNVILDEAALIDNDIEAKIFRMLGDRMDNFYCKIGNPFYRNHFLDSFRDPKYFKMNIDYHKGIKEGRLNQDFIEEARKRPHFSVLYENKFPEADAIDDKGWSYLITDEEYERARVKIAEPFGLAYLGQDVARGGGNFNVWVKRTADYATVLGRNNDSDLMSQTGTTIRFAKEHEIDWQAISIDDTGVGGGVSDRLREQGFRINAVKLGEQARDTNKFTNRRAENYWKVKEWLNQGGKLDPDSDWSELLEIKYKTDSSGKLKIMSKDEMRSRGIESPDIADSLALSFDSLWSPHVKRQIDHFDEKMRAKRKRAKYLRMA